MISGADRDERLHEKNPKEDGRGRAARDRDRLLYCSAFRRLAEVTQVVAAETAHVFHNRLTHSLQVAQVGRRIAERLIERYPTELRASEGLNPDVVEAACLAHDLGHPPFGHTAEVTLNECAETFGGFEGNAQSFRIVTRLAFRRTSDPGLDLTRATLGGILKYPWLRGANPEKPDKWGAYETERDAFEFARGLRPEPNARTIEAELMDWSDDVTYAVHDMEDFYRAGRIPLHLLASETDDRERRYFFEDVFERRKAGGPAILARRPELEKAFQELATDLFPDEPYTGLAAQRAVLRHLSGFLIGRYISGVSLAVQNGRCAVSINSNLRDEILMLKQLTWTYVIGAPSLASQQHGQRKIIRGLYDEYKAAADAPELGIFPPHYQERLTTCSNTDERHRVCVDLIAGMTEKQAVATYLRLSGVALGQGLEDLLS